MWQYLVLGVVLTAAALFCISTLLRGLFTTRKGPELPHCGSCSECDCVKTLSATSKGGDQAGDCNASADNGEERSTNV